MLLLLARGLVCYSIREYNIKLRSSFFHLDDGFVSLGNGTQFVQNIPHYLSLAEGSPDEWRHLLEVNVVALCLCTKEAVASMRRRNVEDGHIFNLSRSVLSILEESCVCK
jgi:hypothetical protein